MQRETRGPWILTHTEKKFYLRDPKTYEVDIQDIAHALSNIQRFGGHLPRTYSVAQHSILVAMMLPLELQLAGLLHDAHEAYTGDISRPLKLLIRTHMGAWLDHMESNIQSTIYEKFRVVLTPDVAKSVKHADDVMLVTEAVKFFGVDPLLFPEAWSHQMPEMSVPFTNLSQQAAKDLFLRTFHRLYGEGDV